MSKKKGNKKMKALTLKGCTLKEKLDFIKEIGLNKTESPKEYRQLMGWHTKETEYLFFKFRESQIEKRNRNKDFYV